MRQNANEVELFLPRVLVSSHKWTHGRPMLGSVVVRKDTGTPGDGCLKGAGRLGQFKADGQKDMQMG